MNCLGEISPVFCSIVVSNIDLRSVKDSIVLDFKGSANSHESWATMLLSTVMFSNDFYDAFEMVSWKSYKTSSIKRFPLLIYRFILRLWKTLS